MLCHVIARSALALGLAGVLATPAAADELRPAESIPEAQQRVLADETARAFDHIRAARRELAARDTWKARRELAQAGALLDRATAASPATRVEEEISVALARLADPTTTPGPAPFAAIFDAIDAAGDAGAWTATRRYVERAHYFRRDADAATRELISAAARIPYGEIDGPVSAAKVRVRMAAIELAAGRLGEADAILRMAESSAVSAVQIAGGAVEPGLADVAAPPPPLMEAEPEATESEMPAPTEFDENNGHGPADSEAGPTSDVEPETEMAPEVEAEPEMAPETDAEPEMAPETVPEAEEPATGA
jgi:hypothetical protein